MAIPLSAFTILNTYNISLLASSVIGSNFNNAKVLSICTYADAIQTSTDIVSEHARMLKSGLLDASTSTDPTKLIYIKIQTNAGATRALAVDWIKSVTAINTVSLNIIVTGASSDDEAAIRTYLTSRGLSFTVS